MDSPSFNCYNCRRPLREADLQRGTAIQIGSLVSCEACAGELLDRLTPEQQQAALQRHAALSSTAMPAAPARYAPREAPPRGVTHTRRGAPPASRNRAIFLVSAAGGGAVVLAALLLGRGRPDDPPREESRPPEPPPLLPVPPRRPEPAAPSSEAGLPATVAALGSEVRGMADRGAYREAKDRLERARAERSGFEWVTAVDRLSREVEEALASRYERLKAEALAAHRDGRTDAVNPIREEVARWGDATRVEDLKKALAPSVPGLVGWWKLDAAGGRAVADASGRGNDGTLTGNPAWRPGEGLALDGDQDGVRIPRAPHLEPAAVTVSIWVWRDGTPASWANVVRKTWKNNSKPTYASYTLQLNPNGKQPDGAGVVTGKNGGNDIMTSTPGAVPDRTWVHLAFTYDPAGAAPQKRLYVNGVLNASKPVSDPVAYDATSTGDLLIGQNGRGDEQLKGRVRDARVYDRALTAEEVRGIHAAGAR